MAKRLTKDQWAIIRDRWEGSQAHGFEWLVLEVKAAFDYSITRQGMRKAANDQGWAKRDEYASEPLAKVNRQKLKTGPKPEIAKTPEPIPFVPVPLDISPTRPFLGQGKRKLVGGVKSDDTGLNGIEEAFCGYVAMGLNATVAMEKAHPLAKEWSRKDIGNAASLAMAKPVVKARIQELLRGAAEVTKQTVESVLNEYALRLRADPRELTAIHVSPCRYCNGRNHQYQYTDGELAMETEKWENKRSAKLDAGGKDIGAFNKKGGGGFSAHNKPNPECPRCAGAGEPRAVLKDSREYGKAAAALFVAAKQGKDGIEVKVTDRMEALGNIARHVGFYEADNETDMNVIADPAALDAIYGAAMQKSRERTERMRADRKGQAES